MSNDVQSILYASDLSRGCENVLAFAISFANRLGAKLHVLTVIPEEREKSLVEVDSYVPQAALDEYHDDRAQRVKDHMEAQIAAFYAVRPEMDATRAISEITVRENDDVAQLILDEAKAGHADMILMGSRGDVGLVGLLLFGSVVLDVARNSPVPLLLVPIHEREKAGADS